MTNGVANWRVYHGHARNAIALFQQVVVGEAWNSWGFIGSEQELIRLDEAGARQFQPSALGQSN